jgi:aminocarboxymuconate-semialdehyde decarboxylase
MAGLRVIDTQSHWFPRALLDSYLDFEDYPRCRRAGDGYAFETAPGRWMPIGPSFYDLDHQLAAYDEVGIDVMVSSSASYGDVDRHELGRARELAAAVNEERAAAQRAHPSRFVGLATLPWQDTDAALSALNDAIGRLELRGVLIHSNIAGAPIDDERCRPVYARIADLGVPLFIHPAMTVAEEKLRDWGLEYLVGFMFDSSLAGLRLILSGVVSDHPKLRIVLPHCGGVLPYLSGRIDAVHSRPFSLGRSLSPLPSEQLRGFYSDTLSRSQDAIEFARGFFVEDRMMFGSDYPFFPAGAELRFVQEELDDQHRDAVLFENAARLIGLT